MRIRLEKEFDRRVIIYRSRRFEVHFGVFYVRVTVKSVVSVIKPGIKISFADDVVIVQSRNGRFSVLFVLFAVYIHPVGQSRIIIVFFYRRRIYVRILSVRRNVFGATRKQCSRRHNEATDQTSHSFRSVFHCALPSLPKITISGTPITSLSLEKVTFTFFIFISLNSATTDAPA